MPQDYERHFADRSAGGSFGRATMQPVDDRPMADFRVCSIDPGCPCGAGGDATHPDPEPQPEQLGEVWCDKCDQPAVSSYRLTTGALVFRCSLHGWLLKAPGMRRWR
jgi:hypothetical protein